MSLNKFELLTFLNKLARLNEAKELMKKASKKKQRQIRDQLVYRLMFDKLRSDDNGDTDQFLNLIKEENESNKSN